MLSKEQDLMRAKLGDMDSAKLLEDELTKSGLPPVGTEGFAAPEVQNCHSSVGLHRLQFSCSKRYRFIYRGISECLKTNSDCIGGKINFKGEEHGMNIDTSHGWGGKVSCSCCPCSHLFESNNVSKFIHKNIQLELKVKHVQQANRTQD